MTRLIITILLFTFPGIVIAGEAKASVPANGLPNSKVSFRGKFTSTQAMKAIFGNIDSAGVSKWSPSDICNKESLRPGATIKKSTDDDEGMQDAYLNSFMNTINAADSANTAEGYAVLKAKENGKDYVYFVIETELSFCLACSALISTTKWESVHDEWHIVNSSLCLAPMGNAGGYEGPVKLVKTGDEKYSLIFHENHDDWGQTLIASPDLHGGWQVSFNQATNNGNTQGRSSCANAKLMGLKAVCWKYTSDITFVKGADIAHYDLIQTTSGTTEVNKKIVPYNHKFIYLYKEGRYLQGESPLAK